MSPQLAYIGLVCKMSLNTCGLSGSIVSYDAHGLSAVDTEFANHSSSGSIYLMDVFSCNPIGKKQERWNERQSKWMQATELMKQFPTAAIVIDGLHSVMPCIHPKDTLVSCVKFDSIGIIQTRCYYGYSVASIQ